ncbi:MAG: hypothetical protein ACRDHF_16710 [Tepidiformaceae bacterium]
MNTLFVTAVLVFPIAMFGTVLWRRREWRTLALFVALALSMVGAALVVGYQDYRSTVGSSPLLSNDGLELHLTFFGMIGVIAADWLAFIWGGWYWLRRRSARPARATRADRRREARARAVASPGRGMTK